MFPHRLLKILLGIALLLTLQSKGSASAQTPGGLGKDGFNPCSESGISRSEAWVKDLPCVPSFYAVSDPLSGVEPAAPPDIIQSEYPSNGDYTNVVFSSYRDRNYEIYGVTAPWYNDGIRYSIRMTNDPSSDLRPRLRPGTTQILFVSDRTVDYNLYLMDWGGGNLRQLTSDPAYDSQAAWSPNGEKIAFVSDRDGSLEIYVMQADGSGLTRLTYDAAADFAPYWSPDGAQIIWVQTTDGEYGTLYAMNADGSNPRKLTNPLRFLGHPSWSGEEDLIAFDYDANLDGWNDLGVMNADGSNLHTVANGGYLIDYWAGSWPMVERYELLNTCITYVVWHQKLYIQHAEIGRYNLLEGGGGSFAYSDLDFYADSAMIDITIPETHVEPLPVYSRAGDIPITVEGTDPGPAMIYNMYLQNRLGLNGEWEDLFASPFTNQFTHIYSAQAGTTVFFRSRGWDSADHYEDWPPGDGDTFTQVYEWQLAGSITDNRGNPIPQALAHTDPVFTDQAYADYLGNFHRYVPSSPVTVSVSGAGYGVLPITTLSSQADFSYTWVLPPSDNKIANGDFEQGLASWLNTGLFPASPVKALMHTGSTSGGLGSPNLVFDYQVISDNPIGSYQPRAASDVGGTLHVIWAGNIDASTDGIFYTQKPLTGTWTTPVVINPGHTNFSGHPEIALGEDGTVHAVWLDWSYGASYVRYAVRDAGGSWSAVEEVSGPRYIWEPVDYSKPDIAVDSLNTVHVVWADQDGFWYTRKPEAGVWSEPLKIDGNYSPHAITIGSDDVLHVVYAGFPAKTAGLSSTLLYKTRSSAGVWSSIEIAVPTDAWDINIAVEPLGKIYLLWWFDFTASYAERSPTGQWSTPIPLSAEDDVYHIELGVSASNPHVLWVGNDGPKYRRRFGNAAWSPVFNFAVSSWYDGGSILPQDDHLLAFWSNGDSQSTDIAYGEWDLPQLITSSLSQVVYVSSELHQPTLSFLYFPSQVGSGGSFHVDINHTPIFSASQVSKGWEHEWVDLSPWLSQTVTVTFRVDSDLSLGLFSTHIDDVSLGSWLAPVVDTVEPGHVDAWVPITITITGENFLYIPSIRLNDMVLTGVEMLDDHTLRVTLPSGLAPGSYDLWVINPGGQEGVKLGGVRAGQFAYLPILRK